MKTLDAASSQKRLAFWLLLVAAVAALVVMSIWLARCRMQGRIAGKATTVRAVWTARHNGSFGGLEAGFSLNSLNGGIADVYIEVPTVYNGETGRHELAPDYDELRPRWRHEPLYHEAYALSQGQWVRRLREFSRESDAQLEFGSCDDHETVNLNIDKQIRDELPQRIQVKSILRFKRLIVAIYSDANEQRPYPFDDHPPLEMDLLEPDGSSWRVVDSQEVDEYGFYCGASTFLTELESGEIARLLFVHVEDASATSVYYNVESFLVREMAIPGQLQHN
jgi:hypothetical protein